MRDSTKFYIDGVWAEPVESRVLEVVSPVTEAPFGRIALGAQADLDRAVAAARRAFPVYAASTMQDRIALFERLIAEYRNRRDDLCAAIVDELGCPPSLARDLHAMVGLVHLKTAMNVLKDYPFREQRGPTLLRREPIGVCGFITPWNWPVNQIAAKVAPALACGCTIVLKPSELSPFSATIWAEIMQAAGVPAGVFNMVHGLGPDIGRGIAQHPGIDMVSFTGSKGAGVEVMQHAAPTVKRVHQELGGKSANIVLPDADFPTAVAKGVRAAMMNSGQTCNAPTRMLVPRVRLDEAIDIARTTAGAIRVGSPEQAADIGPVVSRRQFDKVQAMIRQGIDEGARLIAGGPGRPEGLGSGFFVRPTVFAATNSMSIAREEIFGPVLCVIAYDTVEQAIDIANDSPFGIAGYVQGRDEAAIAEVVERLRVGQVSINYPTPDPMAPFGGYKESGNGREWGDHAFEAYLELKAVLGGTRAA
jgi:aldehyde dehydrogenase (NAD+)